MQPVEIRNAIIIREAQRERDIEREGERETDHAQTEIKDFD